MSGLTSAFPVLVAVAMVVMLVLLVRLERRVSRGSLSPGPREPVEAKPPGLLATPWELRAIDEQLRGLPGDRHRSDLVKTVNRLITSSGIRDETIRLPFDATDAEIETVIAELERRLELGQLLPGRSDQELGSSNR